MPVYKNEYHFNTYWLLKATEEEVFHILNKPSQLSRWWPAVYLDVQILEEGQTGGIGKVAELYTKGFFPYTIRWSFRSLEKEFPNRLVLEAFGDLEGKGIWTIKQKKDSAYCEVQYDWRIKAEKPLLKKFSFILKPLFEFNHEWAMYKGEKSIKLELLRQRAKTEEERKRISKPPGPSFPHNFMNNKVFAKEAE